MQVVFTLQVIHLQYSHPGVEQQNPEAIVEWDNELEQKCMFSFLLYLIAIFILHALQFPLGYFI